MTLGTPPLRFLAIVVGGWVGVRAALLGSAWTSEQPPAPPLAQSASAERSYPRLAYAPLPDEVTGETVPLVMPAQQSRPLLFLRTEPSAYSPRLAYVLAGEFEPPYPAPPGPGLAGGLSTTGFVETLPPTARRLSGSAWLFLRDDGPSALAPGGTLGGSQAGLRLSYRLNDDLARPLSISARLYAPLDDLDGAEVAAGIEWQPLRSVPVRLLAERRQALGSTGRSAFSLLAYGGFNDAEVAGPVVADAYGQAGIVGGRSTDLFADGSLRLSVAPARGVKVGAGIWGAAQPDAERLDVGPAASVRITPRSALQADWRFRIAGDAAPDSGPTVTLATDF